MLAALVEMRGSSPTSGDEVPNSRGGARAYPEWTLLSTRLSRSSSRCAALRRRHFRGPRVARGGDGLYPYREVPRWRRHAQNAPLAAMAPKGTNSTTPTVSHGPPVEVSAVATKMSKPTSDTPRHTSIQRRVRGPRSTKTWCTLSSSGSPPMAQCLPPYPPVCLRWTARQRAPESCSGIRSGCAPNGPADVAVLCLLHRRVRVRQQPEDRDGGRDGHCGG